MRAPGSPRQLGKRKKPIEVIMASAKPKPDFDR
jgi:hypothetical protein